MGRLDQRLVALEKTGTPKKLKASKKRSRPRSKEQIAEWWAEQWNWTRAAQIAGIGEVEIRRRWGQQTGWGDHVDTVGMLTAQAEALCDQEQPQQEKPEPKQDQPPSYLQGSKRSLDRRRWNYRRHPSYSSGDMGMAPILSGPGGALIS